MEAYQCVKYRHRRPEAVAAAQGQGAVDGRRCKIGFDRTVPCCLFVS